MSDSELLSELYYLQLEKWLTVAMSALAIFEFVTTLDQEVSSVWKRKRSGASLLLFAVRYTMLATAIENLACFAQLNYRECVGVFVTNDIVTLLGFLLTASTVPVPHSPRTVLILFAVFSALRVYALCGGSIRLSAVTLLLQLSPVIANAYDYTENTYSIDPLLGCAADDRLSLKAEGRLILASRIPLALGDALVVAITWVKTFQQLKMQRSVGVHLPLSTLLYRDGTAYFIIILILNILELCPLTSYAAGSLIGSLNSTLPIILVNRFMLNLRQLSDDETRSASHIRTIKTPIFHVSVDITGNMGESLEHGWEPETRDDDEVELQDGSQGDEVLELQEVLRDDGFEIQEIPRGDEEAGPSRYGSE